jgi:hypothetical protein
MTHSPYGGLPTWLDEGLAMRSEGVLTPFFQNILDLAVEEDSLISVQSISSPFSAISTLSYLSYAESYTLVDYLITTYGKDKMFELLETFQGGASYNGALTEVYETNTSDLNRQLREYFSLPVETVDELTEAVSEAQGIHSLLAATLAALVTLVILLLSLATESWTWEKFM